MKPLYVIVGVIQALGLALASAPNAANNNKPSVEKYTLSPGSVANTIDPDDKVEASPQSPDSGEEFELDPSEVTAAIAPGDDDEATQKQSRDRLGRRSCPFSAPWLCEGETCFNFFEYSCCKGGVVCKNPQLCIKNAVGDIVCK